MKNNINAKLLFYITIFFSGILLLNPVFAENSGEKIILLAIDDFQSNYLENVQEYIVREHINNNIPVTLGVIPADIEEPLLTKIKNWNNNPIIEVAQHDYTHDTNLIGKNYTFQYNYLKRGTDLLNSYGIYPKSFVPAAGQADDTTVQVLKDLGFHTIYDGIYINLTPSANPLTLTDQLHLCENNGIGINCKFKPYEMLKLEIEQKIQQYGVALIMYHMQDFEGKNNNVNINKMHKLISYANNFTRDGYTLMTVEQYYQHKIGKSPSEICQYAQFAEATNESSGYEARYSTGVPDSDGNCGTEPLPNISWQKTNWNFTANITFTFPSSVYPDNLSVFGDYDLCLDKVWMWRNNKWYLVQKGNIDKSTGKNCSIIYNFNSLNFKTNKIKLKTCSWSWSAIDAVKFCGSVESFPKINLITPIQNEIIDNSENNVLILISTDVESECKFSYDEDFIFDEGFEMSTTNGLIHSYTLNKPESTDSIEIYYKCKNINNNKITPYSMMHRFSFKNKGRAFIGVCEWYGCAEGAVSISDDDGYHTTLGYVKAVCKEELEKRGLKGTYFLANTGNYSQSDWDIWRDVYDKGHEIGGHSLICSYEHNKDSFTKDVQSNIEDIINNIGMSRDEIITYAWPCGIALPKYQKWLSDYYLFSRGYHINSIESKNPENFLNYKSINSVGFGENPPDYYLLADVTENHQGWINYVYHDSCDNSEIFDYLLTKDLWIDTIGAVSKYITERNSVSFQNIVNTPTGVKFDLINNLNTTIFDKELTLKIYLGNANVENIKINGLNTKFTQFTKGGQNYVKFNVPSKPINNIEINGLKIEIPHCGDNKVNQWSEECDDGNLINGDGCNSECKDESPEGIYVILYVGNIDGSISPIWYHFYDKLTTYFENNKIPVAFSFLPATINTKNPYFSEIFKRMYLADNIELIQKGFKLDETEKHLDELSLEEQKQIIKNGRYFYIDRMKEILGTTDIKIPATYVAPFGRFTATTRRVLEELGFKTNFGVYYVDELGYVESTPTLDSIQYGVSFTKSGRAGRKTVFKEPDQIIEEVLSYNRMDVPILKINGKKVVPLYVHHPDFEHRTINGEINETKWKIYNETITRLLNNPNITFITPNQVWKMRHPFCIPTEIPETLCNGVDDDCDGEIDEDYTSVATTCGINIYPSTGRLKCIGYELDTCKPGILVWIILIIIILAVIVIVIGMKKKMKNKDTGELV